MVAGLIPEPVADFGRRNAERQTWVDRLPRLIETYVERWELLPIAAPMPTCRGAAWVGATHRRDGSEVVLKLAWPHWEAETEAAGLRCFDGRAAVRLLAHDETDFALLLERCRPGHDLRSLPTPADADAVAVDVLRRLWRPANAPGASAIGALADTVAAWNAEFESSRAAYPPAIVEEAAQLGLELVRTTTAPVVVHGDFNPSNVLTAEREPWLAIDPKPLVGDQAYDLAQYLANWTEEADAGGDPTAWFVDRVASFAASLHLDPLRVAAWAFVKAVGWNWGPRTAELFRDVRDRFA